MRHVSMLVVLVLAGAAPSAASDELKPASLPEWADSFEKELASLDRIYADLANERLPIYDENGEPLGHRPVENRRQALAGLRETLGRLKADPQNLYLAVSLLMETEALSDDLFDLAQTAYDNDREQLARRAGDATAALDRRRDALQDYALVLARDAQGRVKLLEDENRALREQLKSSGKPQEGALRRPPAPRDDTGSNPALCRVISPADLP